MTDGRRGLELLVERGQAKVLLYRTTAGNFRLVALLRSGRVAGTVTAPSIEEAYRSVWLDIVRDYPQLWNAGDPAAVPGFHFPLDMIGG